MSHAAFRPSCSASLLACALAVAGCASGASDREGSDGGQAGVDAGSTPTLDAGVRPGFDAALPPSVDGGPPLGSVDGGSPIGPVDAGPGASDAGVDAGPMTPPPECVSDAECGLGESCDRGYCRTPCFFGACLSGGECDGSFCVDCTSDSDCAGSRYRCDTSVGACVTRPVDTSGTLIGLFYSTWHCPQATGNPHGRAIHDISEILAGRQSWGPLREFHWWDEPEAGYYCLSRDDALLRRHAEQIRDAGVDFIFVDATNWAYMDGRSDRVREMVTDPLERLLAVWSTVPGAPRVVPWVPVISADTNPSVYTVDYLLERLAAYPGMQQEYLGRPLLFVTEAQDRFSTNEAKLRDLSSRYTIRRMWAHMSRYDDSWWSFMEPCAEDPSSGRPCRQRNAIRGGSVEQVSIAAAYQWTYMSVPEHAVPKHRGRTLRSQFETLFDHPEAGVATITGWNEWTIQRIPCGEHESCPCSRYSACFLDAYDMEYSRDIEPGRNAMGDYYYRLMQACIGLYRSGETCDTRPGDLCCRSYPGT